jgi:hypothetical protein
LLQTLLLNTRHQTKSKVSAWQCSRILTDHRHDGGTPSTNSSFMDRVWRSRDLDWILHGRCLRNKSYLYYTRWHTPKGRGRDIQNCAWSHILPIYQPWARHLEVVSNIQVARSPDFTRRGEDLFGHVAWFRIHQTVHHSVWFVPY